MSDFLLISALAELSSGKGFGFNSNFLEANVLNIALLVSGVFYLGKNFLTSALELRQQKVTEAIQEAEERTAAAEADLSMIRSQRDYHLQVCDWTQGSDSPLTDEKKAEWATYRQELRDFPAGKTTQGDFARDEDGVMDASPPQSSIASMCSSGSSQAPAV